MSEQFWKRRSARAAQGLFKSSPVQASLLRVVSIAIGIVSSVVMARWGGAEIKGEFSSFVALTNLLFAAVNLDIAQQIIRVGRERRDQNNILSWTTRPWAMYAILALFAAVSLYFIDRSFSWIVVGTLSVTLATQAGVLLNAVGGTVSLAFQALFQQAVLLVGSICLAALNMYSTTTVYGLAVFASVAALLYAIPGILPKSAGNKAEPRPSVLDLARVGVRWQPLRIGQMALHKGDVLLVYVLLGAPSAGVYSVAISLSSLSSILPQQISQHVLFLGANNREVSMRRSVVSALGFGAAASAFIAAICHPLIRIMYGAEFSDAANVVFATLPGATAIPIFQILSNHYRLYGSARLPALGALLGSAVMVLSAILLVPVLGIIGVGLAFSTGSVFSAVFLAGAYRLVRFG